MKKKWVGIVLILVVSFAFFPGRALAASDGSMEDTIVDKMSDWAATVGKSPEDQDSIIAERRADRAAQRLQKMIKKESHQAEKNMKKLGKDMGKMFE